MGLLILPERRTRQPRGLAPIDWGNPIFREVAFALNPANGARNLVSGNLASTVNAKQVATVSGIGFAAPSGKPLVFSGAPVVTSDGAGTGDFTFLVLANPVSASQLNALISQDASTKGQAYLIANANSSYAATPGSMLFGADTGGGSGPIFSIAGQVDGLMHLWAFIRRGTSYELWRDGILQSAQTGATTNILTGGGQSLAIGALAGYAGYDNPNATVFAAGFNRPLGALKIPDISSNPWKLFSPEPRRLWLGMAAAGTTVTCTVGAASAVGVSSQVNSTLQAGVAAASAAGVTALASMTLQTTVGAAAATGVNAQASVTLQASVAAAGATGVTALLNASVSASVGAAGATGVTAQTAATISAGPGNASATGVNALLPVTAACGPGNAAATGVNAVISVAGSTTIVCTVGAASAAGVAAFVNTTLQTAVGAASAQGVAASTNVTLTAAVGDASAVGVTAMGNVSILASIGNASATGVTAVINLAGSATVVCTVGSASALGVAALLNATLTTSTGDASAVGITANFQSGNLYQPSRFIGYVPFASRIGYVQASKRTGYVPAK